MNNEKTATLLEWTATPIVGGIIYSNEVAPEYEIKASIAGKFFVSRVVADCDDIGPLDTFKEAEDIILKIGVMLVQFEDQAWRICAAQAIKILPALDLSYFSEAVGGGDEE
jgi:hypothetical protein